MDSTITLLLKEHSKPRVLGKAILWCLLTAVFAAELLTYKGAPASLALHPSWLWLTLGFYLSSHLLRAVRLWLILFEEQVPFACVLGLHASTSVAGFLLPFKLGDLLRISEISCILSSLRKGITVQIVDRFFDLLVLILLAVVTLLLGHLSPLHQNAEATIVLFVLILLALMATIFYFTVPNFITYSRHMIILRSRSARGLRVLGFLAQLEELYFGVISLIRDRFGILLLITFGVWLLELLVACNLLSFLSTFHFTDIISQLFTRFNFLSETDAVSSGVAAGFSWVVGGYVACACPLSCYYLFLRVRLLKDSWERAQRYGKPYTHISEHYTAHTMETFPPHGA